MDPSRQRRSSTCSVTARARAEAELRSLRADCVVFEIAGRVGLRPESDLAGDRRAKDRIVRGEEIGVRRRSVAAGTGRGAERVLERELAIEPRLEVGAVDRQLQLM